MKNYLAALALLIAVQSVAQPADNAKMQSIKKLFSIIHTDSLTVKTMEASYAGMEKNFTAMLQDTSITHGLDIATPAKQLLDKYRAKSKTIALDFVTNQMPAIYYDFFTQEDINDYIAFYSSRAGQKLLSSMPEITRAIAEKMSGSYQQKLYKELVEDLQKLTEENLNSK